MSYTPEHGDIYLLKDREQLGSSMNGHNLSFVPNSWYTPNAGSIAKEKFVSLVNDGTSEAKIVLTDSSTVSDTIGITLTATVSGRNEVQSAGLYTFSSNVFTLSDVGKVAYISTVDGGITTDRTVAQSNGDKLIEVGMVRSLSTLFLDIQGDTRGSITTNQLSFIAGENITTNGHPLLVHEGTDGKVYLGDKRKVVGKTNIIGFVIGANTGFDTTITTGTSVVVQKLGLLTDTNFSFTSVLGMPVYADINGTWTSNPLSLSYYTDAVIPIGLATKADTLYVDVSTPAVYNDPMSIGSVIAQGGATPDYGFVTCDGSIYNAVTNPEYQNLYNVIGNTYGGTDNTNFKVPNLNGGYPTHPRMQIKHSYWYLQNVPESAPTFRIETEWTAYNPAIAGTSIPVNVNTFGYDPPLTDIFAEIYAYKGTTYRKIDSSVVMFTDIGTPTAYTKYQYQLSKTTANVVNVEIANNGLAYFDVSAISPQSGTVGCYVTLDATWQYKIIVYKTEKINKFYDYTSDKKLNQLWSLNIVDLNNAVSVQGAGYFDRGVTDPVDTTTRLNYSGLFFAGALKTGTLTATTVNATDISGTTVTGSTLVSNVATGTAPLTVASTTKVTNLNVDMLDGYTTGNLSGNIPISNGLKNVNLNADLLDDLSASEIISAASAAGKVNLIGNPLQVDIDGWVTDSSSTLLQWDTDYPLYGNGALGFIGAVSGDYVYGNLVNPIYSVYGGQAWKIDIGYRLDNCTLVDGELTVVLNDGVIDIQCGTLPIVKGQTVTTSLFAYPSNNLNNQWVLKFTIGGSGKACDLRLANITIAPQQIMTVPAVGGWTKLSAPTIVGFNTNPTKGTVVEDSLFYRRIGDSAEFTYRYRQTVAGSAGSGFYFFTINNILPGFTVDTSKLTGNHIVGEAIISNVTDETTAGTAIGIVYFEPTTQRIFVKLSDPTSASTRVLFWESAYFAMNQANLSISMRFTLPIAQWSNTIQVSGENAEWASNLDNGSGTDPGGNGSVANAVNGFGNFGTFGSAWVVNTTYYRRVSFKSPIRWGFDSLHLFIREKATGKIYDVTLGQTGGMVKATSQNYDYGYTIEPVSTDPKALTVRFPSGGRSQYTTFNAAGLPFSDLGINWEWWVEKRSGGSLAEVPPVVRSEYTQLVNTTLTQASMPIPFTNKIEDTHGAVSNSLGYLKFTAPISGIYRIDAVVTSFQGLTNPTTHAFGISKNGSAVKEASVSYPSSFFVCGRIDTSIRLNAGDTLWVYSGFNTNPGTITLSGSSQQNRIVIELVGK